MSQKKVVTKRDQKRKEVSEKHRQVAEFFENDLFEFAKYLNPDYMYGDIHEHVFRLLQKDDEASRKQLLLLPRGHLKSHCIAVWTVWTITRTPWCSIIYVSAGEELAKAQVYAIKNMLTSDNYRLLWPDMIKEEEAKRDKWTAWAINVDHPLRRERGTRDATLLVRTIKSNATGLHCSHLVFDDVQVPSNAYSPAGRAEVAGAVSQFASILNPGGTIKAVGTRYHPKDVYGQFEKSKKKTFNEIGEMLGEVKVWEIFERAVEDNGDMTGNFLWPRTRNPRTGEWYGFDMNVLAEIKAQYESVGETTQFYAQYYNNPNDPDSQRLQYSDFTYYERSKLKNVKGNWFFNEQPLAVYAGMDIAWTTGTSSDYTAIAVVGVDPEGFIYVLDLDQFRTQDYNEYYEKVRSLQDYWGFRKLRIETNSGGRLVANQLEAYVRQEGRTLVLDPAYTSSNVGKKAERHGSVLEWRYKKKIIKHFKGGLVPDLEDQVVMSRPVHDDLADAVCSAVEICKPPSQMAMKANMKTLNNVVIASNRFGGRRVVR